MGEHISVEGGEGIYPELNTDCCWCGGKKTDICYFHYSVCKKCKISSDDSNHARIKGFMKYHKIEHDTMATNLEVNPLLFKNQLRGNVPKYLWERFLKFRDKKVDAIID